MFQLLNHSECFCLDDKTIIKVKNNFKNVTITIYKRIVPLLCI